MLRLVISSANYYSANYYYGKGENATRINFHITELRFTSEMQNKSKMMVYFVMTITINA